jgi:hypothetical protein
MTLYAKIIDGAVSQYPVTEDIIRAENPTVLFAASNFEPPDGYVAVIATTPPADTITNLVSEVNPVLVKGQWKQKWLVSDAPAEVVSEREFTLNKTKNTIFLSEYELAISQDVEFKGTLFQADPASVANLKSVLLARLPTQTLPDGFYWVASDNTQIPVTYADLQALGEIIFERNWLAFKQYQLDKIK